MFNIKKILVVFCFLAIAGCASSPSTVEKEEAAVTSAKIETEILGIGVVELVSERKTFDPIPIPNYYYGQLLIDTTLYKSAVEGPEAQKLMNYVVSLFGEERKQFGISVVPTLNGVKLPEFVVFSYIYDSEGQSWKSDLTKKYRSPAIPISDFSKIGFKFKYVSSNDKDVRIISTVSDIVSSYGGISPGSWAISTISSPKVKEAAQAVDDIISKMLSNSIESNVNNALEPVSDGSKDVVYRVSTVKDDKLADIKFSTRLFTSLVSGRVLKNTSVPSNYRDAIPTVDPFSNPLNRIRVYGGSEETLSDELRKNGMLRDLTNANSPEAFRQSCRDIIDKLSSSYGLNVFDSLNSMRNALTLTKFVKDKTLYNSGCLTKGEFNLLNKMGVPLNFEGDLAVTPLDNGTLKKLAGFFKSPVANVGFEGTILNLFEENVRITSGSDNLNAFPEEVAIIDRQNLVQRFKLLNAATVCCWGGSVLNGEGEPINNSRPLYFRTLISKVLYAMELYQPMKDKPVDFVRIRVLNEGDISQKARELLMSPAKPLVEGYQTDVIALAGEI
ncbi:hypothetical protein AS19_16600 [Alcanivorax sp. NBRC 101098]|uniref:hypothetical protein n=1 Tax=Alcanivorax sp. NBRC 101098 TaxID=1113728 RepID=UPI0004ABEE21|nr:hypothetical protein [Alcanivorax sp. NBRC 101098]BAP14511.1 hypothetical protein AS19_16600 [Alcanivorax sp. NBRC 101098]